jgi:hypothetical protein
MKRAHHWSSLPLAALLALAPLAACDKKAEPVAPQAAAATEPEPTKTPEPDKQPDKEPAPTPSAVKDPAPAPTPTPSEPTPTPTPAAGDPAPADPNKPAEAGDKPVGVTATQGTVVRDPVPDSPEWLIQQVLVASLEPDFEKGWAHFESLLHEDQKVEHALASRKTLNFPASRRKVNLFIFEQGPKPIYRVERVVEEIANQQYRLFVFNNSPDSMPTPCEVRYDSNLKKWRVGICSL